MNKVKLLRVVNILLFSSFAAQAITSIMIFFKLKIIRPAIIFEIHEYNGLLMIALAVTHITLNWGWIKANFFKR